MVGRSTLLPWNTRYLCLRRKEGCWLSWVSSQSSTPGVRISCERFYKTRTTWLHLSVGTVASGSLRTTTGRTHSRRRCPSIRRVRLAISVSRHSFVFGRDLDRGEQFGFPYMTVSLSKRPKGTPMTLRYT